MLRSSVEDKNSEPGSLFFVGAQGIRSSIRLIAFAGILMLTSACQPRGDPQLRVISGSIMGTYYRVSFVAPNHLDLDQLQQQMEQQLHQVNQAMSTWIESSEVSRVNRAADNTPIALSPPTAEVIRESQRVSKLTGGAFDITVAPLVRLWGFGVGAKSTSRPPTDQQIRDTLTVVGQRHLRLQGDTLRKRHRRTEIDLSAIAKGFAIDQLSELLLRQGLNNWLVDIGGELRAAGLKNGQPWRVAVEIPNGIDERAQVVTLADRAIATSGDYRNFFEYNGRIYSHAIDPGSGYPVAHGLASVSVMHARAMTADALATALLIMGQQAAQEFAAEHNLSVLLIARGESPENYAVIKTGDFLSILQ